jgi:signal transduction histidine kinase
MILFTLLFGFLLFVSRKGFVRLASYALIGIYFILTMYGVAMWSFILPMIILGSIVIIVISSILISTRFGFLITILLGITVGLLTYLQIHNILPVQLYWRTEPVRLQDALEISFIFILVSGISWLSNREMERSLVRARKSEQALIEERNMLEVKVEERTQALKAAQSEQVSQLYRFAEFGKLSSGIFHDLMNPLNAVIANVDQLESKAEIPELKDSVAKAVHASRRMGDFLEVIRKQIKPATLIETFSVNEELAEAVDMLKHKARTSNVSLKLNMPKDLSLFGNPLKFHQIAINLISNAIDSYERMTKDPKIVTISLIKRDDTIHLRVTDHGCGIPDAIKDRIFEQFFTTKSEHKGLGLGLSTTKNILSRDFGGTIAVITNPDGGTTFSLVFPIERF